MRKFTFLLLLLANFAIAEAFTGDSLNYLTPQDTVFLTTGDSGAKIFEHQVERGQTLFSLAKFYGMSVTDVYRFNPELIDKPISVGQKIKIPIPNRAILRYQDWYFIDDDYVPVCYVVKPGDNLFRISKYFFKMPMDTVMVRNEMTNHIISPGQILQVGWMSIYGIADSLRTNNSIKTPMERKNIALQKTYIKKSIRKKEHKQSGVAYWQKNSPTNNELFALHRNAPVNSVISVRNPMTKRTVFVKVIGKLPDSAYSQDIIVILSPKAAKMLGARDPRFFVKVSYLK